MSPPPVYIERGGTAFVRTSLALVASGFSTFAMLYHVQPLMPVFSEVFGVRPAQSSLTLSLPAGVLAFAMLVSSGISEALGRKPVMVASLLLSAALMLAAAAAPAWSHLLMARALMGLALSGLPAVAMAYVGEEMHPRSVGIAMGLYIGGCGLGGMSGRLVTGLLTDAYGWRAAIFAMGLLGMIAGLTVWRSLPPSRHFQARPLALRPLLAAFATHLREPGLRCLFAEAFLLMGAFMSVYNYIGFRLLAPPFSLSPAVVGLVFTVYLIGIFSSAWMGDLAGRLGRRRVLWVALLLLLAGMLLTLVGHLAAIVAGMGLLTFGFFAAHSICSAWVGLRARTARAQATSLYLFFYYAGVGLLGYAGGLFWERYGWPGVVGMGSALVLGGLLIALRLMRIAPLPEAG